MLSDVLKSIFWFVVVVGYLLGGAAVFHHLEAPKQKEVIQEASTKLEQLLKNLTCVQPDDLKQLLQLTGDLSGAKISWENSTLTVEQGDDWSYEHCVFFCATIISTIGYGDITPTTFGSRTFCVFYALFGIPLFLILLARVGQYIAKVNDKLTVKMCQRCSGRAKHAFQVIGVSLVGVVLIFFLPSIAFSQQDGWSYDISLYYSFITMSTIGFGDYVPDAGEGNSKEGWRKITFCIWIVFGLAWFSTLVATIQNMMVREKEEEHPETKTVPVENGHDRKPAEDFSSTDIVSSHL